MAVTARCRYGRVSGHTYQRYGKNRSNIAIIVFLMLSTSLVFFDWSSFLFEPTSRSFQLNNLSNHNSMVLITLIHAIMMPFLNLMGITLLKASIQPFIRYK